MIIYTLNDNSPLASVIQEFSTLILTPVGCITLNANQRTKHGRPGNKASLWLQRKNECTSKTFHTRHTCADSKSGTLSTVIMKLSTVECKISTADSCKIQLVITALLWWTPRQFDSKRKISKIVVLEAQHLTFCTHIITRPLVSALAVPDSRKPRQCPGKILVNCGYCLRKLVTWQLWNHQWATS